VVAEMSALPAEPSAIASTEEVIVSATVLIPSAQYLRRSTEHQQYSLENQQATIAQHADQHGFSVVQTYTDARTGVVLGRRSGLRQLLQDVMSGQAAYKAILVYDVSRWGRFRTPTKAHTVSLFAGPPDSPSIIVRIRLRTIGSTQSSIRRH